jgi:hypothetical protein
MRLPCKIRGHRWQTIITYEGGRKEKQRCLRCARYRKVRLSEHAQVKAMT